MKKLETEEIIRLSTEEYKQASKMPLVVILDNVRSLHNVGAVFRTGDAYRLEKVILCGITATPPHPEIHKSALGAEFSADWEYFHNTCDAVNKYKTEGYTILAIEQAEGSTMLQNITIDSNKKYAVILGNEVKGVDQEAINLCDGCIELPQFGTKHSLNVSITAGIIIWEFAKKLLL